MAVIIVMTWFQVWADINVGTVAVCHYENCWNKNNNRVSMLDVFLSAVRDWTVREGLKSTKS